MKNIQFIDGAMNSAYDVFACNENDFRVLFPGEGQKIEFIEDVIARLDDASVGEIILRVSAKPVRKSEIVGIHATMFFDLESKRKYYPNKREADLDRDRGWNHG